MIQSTNTGQEQPSHYPLDSLAPRRQPTQHIDPRALRAWRVSGTISTMVVLLIGIGISLILRWAELPWYVQLLPLVAAIATGVLEIWLIPEVRWRRWRYDVSERELDLQHGVLIVTRSVIPMVRVQHVDTRQGPILRHYGLATVEIATAAGKQEIPALSVETADHLRTRIAALAGVAEDV